jgi:ATP-binding cassette subfamily C protein
VKLQVAKTPSESILVPLRLFLRDFAAFTGARGLKALLFVFLGAVVEGVGLVLLIPFFSVIIDSQNVSSWTQRAPMWLFSLLSAEMRISKLAVLAACFGVLLVARAVIITARDVTMAEIEIGFIQQIRSRITARLASAGWDTISRLRYSRITHLMGADIQQLSTATNILVHDAAAVVMLASQIVLAFLLAPALAALAMGMLLLGAIMGLPLVRRAQRVGTFVASANLSLIDATKRLMAA